MNLESRLYLSARRPGGQDDQDPAIAGALAQTQTDPALAAWLDEQNRTDTALALKLRQVQPPAGLRDRILAGAKVSQSRWRSWFDRKAWRGFRNSELLAAAAIVLILAVAIALRYVRRDVEALDWQAAGALEVARIETGQRQVEKTIGNLSDARAWLAAQICPSPAGLPESVRDFRVLACSTMRWKNQPMSIVCFGLENGKEVHLVTIDRKHLPAAPPEGAPEFKQIGDYQTASWSEGNVAMMLLGKVERTQIEKFFRPRALAAFAFF